MQATYLSREKLLQYGAGVLTELELWSCVLGSGTQRLPLSSLVRLVTKELERRPFSPTVLGKQLGAGQLCRVLAVRELSRREKVRPAQQLHSLEDVLLLTSDLRKARQERVVVWYCSVSGEIIHTETVALGTLNAAAISPREVFSALRQVPFDSLLIAHNHPSGNPTPSQADLLFTSRLEAACEIMGCWLRDHVIVTSDEVYSFRQKGKLSSDRRETAQTPGQTEWTFLPEEPPHSSPSRSAHELQKGGSPRS